MSVGIPATELRNLHNQEIGALASSAIWKRELLDIKLLIYGFILLFV
jgi:hypothetical protein